ncbi:MAG: PhzF family phenazine biosynthesis protein [Pseudomonadota bacterium]
MLIERISAFSTGNTGGNPAGVVIADELPPVADMAQIAAEVGYSETAFASPLPGGGWRVRYFAPASEVPFCGHATIALGAALGARFGPARYELALNDAEIAVEAAEDAGTWSAALTSPPTSHEAPDPDLVRRMADLFAIAPNDLSENLSVTRASAGADMLIVPLASRARLAQMDYDLEAGAALQNDHGLVGIYFVVEAEPRLFDVRMAFASGGVLEDPATGAAAAAFAGWLRDSGRLAGKIEIRQGDDMGMPSRLTCLATPQAGSAIRVSGATRRLA